MNNDNLTLDDRFHLLLHKKIMNKTGSAKRSTKKYYKDQYKKTGIIPKPLLLAEKGIMDGRKASGRPVVIDEQTKKRFIEMVKASCDHSSQVFIFIPRYARTIKNFHFFLEEEFSKSISLPALRRLAIRENLKVYLEKPDYDKADVSVKKAFQPEKVFDLIQIDGCRFRYFKIKDENGYWKKPQVIEVYDTGSRYMFVLEPYFSESSLNACDLFTCFLINTSFPRKKIRLRPDNPKGFVNLKRVIHAINLEYSTPDGFYFKSDFARVRKPKDKSHLESSHRSLHNFEIRIIKAFEKQIVKTVPETIFRNGKKEVITVTLLDITLQDLRYSNLINSYRDEHNRSKHYFSEGGNISSWVPEQKMDAFLSTKVQPLTFSSGQVKAYMKYGFKKIDATVSTKRTIRHDNREYQVIIGKEKFSQHKSTPVKISRYMDKLFIFEKNEDGILLGEAIAIRAFEKPPEPINIARDEISKIIDFLESQCMIVDRSTLIEIHQRGLTLEKAEQIYHHNQARYTAYMIKIKLSDERKGIALFNAFILDAQKTMASKHVATYASHGELT